MVSLLEEGIVRIIKEYKLPIAFPKKVVEEVKKLSHEDIEAEVSKRVDLRAETIITIDGEKARDFDDAVSIEKTRHGYLLKVSIADVSYYVPPGSATDQEAYRRGNSSYFPDRCLPMLPERLSNNLCSLVPEEDRLTVTAEMNFDENGHRTKSIFYRSVIRSTARMTYTQVRRILVDQDPAVLERHEAIVPGLRLMEELAQKIMKVRNKRGSLDFDLPEPEIILDLEERKIENILKAERNIAHRLIEEFMIAANEAVAEFLSHRKVPSLYRVHGKPDEEKLTDFMVSLSNRNIPFKSKEKGGLSKALGAVIESVRGKPEERVINTLLLRTMKQAVYDTKNIGHFGLASTHYTHFTSPIRRYPDLVIHRLLLKTLNLHQKTSKPPTFANPAVLQKVARQCSETERNSMKAEWASRDYIAALFMENKIGSFFEGVISNVTRFGFFVELNDYFLEGLVLVRSLKDDYYVFQESANLLVGRRTKRRFSIGMSVKVRVAGVNLEKRWIDLELS